MDLESEKELLTQPHKDELEHILTQRIGYGPAQDKLTLALNLLLFTEGCQSVAIGLLLPELELQWNISTFQKSLLITIVYLGVSLGSYLQSYSDNIGRSVFIKWNAILQLIFGILSCVATSMTQFVIFRFFYGIGIGIVLPLSATYMSEITPSKNRAIILTKSRTFWSSGCLVTCVLAWGFLYTHRWRTLLLIICLPGVYALWEQMRAGKQSLRYMWVHKRTDEVTDLLNTMAKLNGKQEQFTTQQISYLITIKQKQIQRGSFKNLLNDKYRSMTVYLAVAWFAVGFIYYGVLLLLPSILARNSQITYNFKYICLTVISVLQMLCYYYSRNVMDHPQLGRKKTTYIAFMVCAICSLILIILNEDQTYAILGVFFIIKMFITTTFMTLYPYSAQIYSTLDRGKAMGIFSLSGRIATTTLGFLGVNALNWFNGNGLYVLFLVLGCVSSALIHRMPYCTLGRALDT